MDRQTIVVNRQQSWRVYDTRKDGKKIPPHETSFVRGGLLYGKV